MLRVLGCRGSGFRALGLNPEPNTLNPGFTVLRFGALGVPGYLEVPRLLNVGL